MGAATGPMEDARHPWAGKVWRWAKGLVRWLAILLVVAALPVILAWTVWPDVGSMLGLTPDRVTGLVAASLGCIFVLLLDVNANVEALRGEVRSGNSSGARSSLVPDGVRGVFPPLKEALERPAKAADRTLDVVGLSLYSAWPQLSPWVESDRFRGWTLRMHLLDSDALGPTPPDWVHPTWLKHADSMMASIRHKAAADASRLKDIGARIEVYRYGHLPAVHGFLLGDGTLLISFIHWKAGQHHLDDPHQFYEKFEAGDGSQRARLYRDLFENWLRRAQAQPPVLST